MDDEEDDVIGQGEDGRGRILYLARTSSLVLRVCDKSKEGFGTRARGASNLVGQALRDLAGPRLDWVDLAWGPWLGV